MKIVVTDFIHTDQEYERQAMAAAGHELEAFQLKFAPEETVYAHVKDADAIVVNMTPMRASLIERLDRCKLIIRHGVGYDNVDVSACTRKGIQFAYQPSYCAIEVAEHAIALILATCRHLDKGRACLEHSSRKGEWDFTGLFPIYRMEGKTLGVFGVGRIGSHVVRKMGAFGMRILGCDPLLTEERKRDLGIEFVDRETLFREADVLTLHAPANDETRHCVNAESLKWMKPTAHLVNTARAALIDTPALVEALRNDQIAGAALDVFDVEPPPADHPLYGLKNAILTPHMSWASAEAGQQIRREIVEDLLLFGEGKNARHVVNKEILKTAGTK